MVETFKILSSSFLKYTVPYCYLQAPYCAIAYQNFLFLSSYNLVLIDQPLLNHHSPLVSLASDNHIELSILWEGEMVQTMYTQMNK
jgi:hypothetical protein